LPHDEDWVQPDDAAVGDEAVEKPEDDTDSEKKS
jgi:hypothetical protein